MRILAIIPARGGSKGVPGKNIKMLGGKPLLQFTSDRAKDSVLLTKIILSSEDEAIIAVATDLGIEVPFVRPAAFATDVAKSIDVMQHAVAFLQSKGEYFDAVCLLQVTSPFREKDFIDRAIEKFIATDVDTLISVLPVPHEYNPHWVFEEDESGNLFIATGEAEIISRRQELPKAYHRDGALYLTKIDYIKQGTFYGPKIGFIESNPDLHVNIDTLPDWQQAEEKVITYLNSL
jgi:CMP-N,N'-diacetyllegionaminic acid synthase